MTDNTEPFDKPHADIDVDALADKSYAEWMAEKQSKESVPVKMSEYVRDLRHTDQQPQYRIAISDTFVPFLFNLLRNVGADYFRAKPEKFCEILNEHLAAGEILIKTLEEPEKFYRLPHIGLNVHYESHGSKDGKYKSTTLPAIVTAVHTFYVVDLCVFNQTENSAGVFFSRKVLLGEKPGQWRWNKLEGQ